ncbi:conjugative transposon protein TraJ [Taibaiella koreensis]|uniref:conjugative transposon protein TraJ n=1 Tax=Taibaiella koreensis TaxID=1268548 RepID=UPI000E59AA18|nr:conjugative transposon protein TraJ [Taibaiella koreensis]
MNRIFKAVFIAALGLFVPLLSHAQSNGGGLAGDIKGLQGVLETLYDQMLPMCSQLIGVGSCIAGFAAIWYIASRVWRHLANAEPIDFYPLFRPFVLGFCVINFSMTIGIINGVMKPTVSGTAAMVDNSDKAITTLLHQKEEALKNTENWKMYVGEDKEGDRERWYKYTHDGTSSDEENIFTSIGNDVKFAADKFAYNFQNSVKRWMSEVLQVLFEAAALCINTLRTFQLIILAILGPLVFGIAVFDGFQHTLTAWIARYINVFLWLPVANIFGAVIGNIQQQMLRIDINQVNQTGDTFFSTADTGYLIFMLIGIVGYFTVPSVANSIVQAGGVGSMLQKVTSFSVGNVSNRAGKTADAIGNFGKYYNQGRSGNDGGSGIAGSIGSSIGSNAAYLKDKLSGNSSNPK